MLNSITPVPSQSFIVNYQDTAFEIHLDSGATVSFIKLQLAQSLNITIYPNGQLAQLADEKTRMQSLGEINILITTNGTILLRLRALVVKQLQVGCYAGTTFHVDNQIEANISSGTISLHNGKFVIRQFNKFAIGGPLAHPPPAQTIGSFSHPTAVSDHPVQISSYITSDQLNSQFQQMKTEIMGVLTSSTPRDHQEQVKTVDNLDVVKPVEPVRGATVHMREKKNLLPGGMYKIKLHSAHWQEENVAVIPQFHKLDHLGPAWSPQICSIEDGNAVYKNVTGQVLQHPGGVHFHTISAPIISSEDLDSTILGRSPGPKLSSSTDVVEKLSEMKINSKIMNK